MWIHRAASEMDRPGLEFHHKQQIVGHQPTFGPNLHRREVDGSQHTKPKELDQVQVALFEAPIDGLV